MFRRLVFVGLFIVLLTGLFGGFGRMRARDAYYDGYTDGLQAQAGAESGETAAETAPPAATYRDGYGRGWGILGIFGFIFKFFFFLLLLKLLFGLLGFRHWRRHGKWGRGSWRHHKHGDWADRPGHEKSPKWMDDDDDEPILTV